MVPLTVEVMRGFATLLGSEALECVNGMRHIEKASSEVFEAYKDLYKKFQTVPILFCSHVPDKGIYIWQVNRVCPYKKNSNFMILDTRSLGSDTTPTISIMLLAKIVPEEGEEILDAGFLGGSEFYVQSRIGREKLLIRQYKLADLVELARINPSKQEILANNKHYCKLVIKGMQATLEAKEILEITLWRTKTNEEIKTELAEIPKDEQGEMNPIMREELLLTNTELEFNIYTITTQYCFGMVQRTQNNVSLLFDGFSKTVIAWREDAILVSSYLPENTERIQMSASKVQKNSLYFKSDREMWQITFETFPKVEFSHPEFDQSIFNHWFGWGQVINFQPFTSYRGVVYQDSENPIYDVPISVTNPYWDDQQRVENLLKENTKEDKKEEEKKEEIPLKSVDQIKNEVKQKKKEKGDHETNLKETKEALQDIRAGIKAQMTGIKKYEDEYRELEKKGKNTKAVEEPERVSKEAMDLYSEMKTDKKRMEKQREKEKAQRKDRKSKNDDDF